MNTNLTKLKILTIGFAVLALASSVATAQTSRVFSTSLGYPGNLGGLAGGDQKCNDRAAAASLGGNWVAWLSTTGVGGENAIDRIVATGPFVRATDPSTTIATDKTQLASGTLQNAILYDEFGNAPGNPSAQTGTTSAGVAASNNCDNWTNGSFSALRQLGRSDVTNTLWTEDPQTNGRTCDANFIALYCFEAPTPTPSSSTFSLGLLVGLMLLLLAGATHLLLRRRQSMPATSGGA